MSPAELRQEQPSLLAGVLSALVSLPADAAEHGAAYAVLAVEVVKRQIAIARLVVDDLGAVAVNAPNLVGPVLAVLKGHIVLRLQMVDAEDVAVSVPAFFGLERKLRKRRELAAGVEDRHRNLPVNLAGRGLAVGVGAYLEGRVHRRKACEDCRVLLAEIPGFAAAHGETAGVNTVAVDIVFLRKTVDQRHHLGRGAV